MKVQRCTSFRLAVALLVVVMTIHVHVLPVTARGSIRYRYLQDTNTNRSGTVDDSPFQNTTSQGIPDVSTGDNDSDKDHEVALIRLDYLFFSHVDWATTAGPTDEVYQALACQTDAFFTHLLQTQLETVLRVSLRVKEWNFAPPIFDNLPQFRITFEILAYYDDRFVYDMAVDARQIVAEIDAAADFQAYITNYAWLSYPIDGDATAVLRGINRLAYDAAPALAGETFLYDTVTCPPLNQAASTWQFGFFDDYDSNNNGIEPLDIQALACQMRSFVEASLSKYNYGAAIEATLQRLDWNYNDNDQEHPLTVTVDITAMLIHHNGDHTTLSSSDITQVLQGTTDLVDFLQNYVHTTTTTTTNSNVWTNVKQVVVEAGMQDIDTSDAEWNSDTICPERTEATVASPVENASALPPTEDTAVSPPADDAAASPPTEAPIVIDAASPPPTEAPMVVQATSATVDDDEEDAEAEETVEQAEEEPQVDIGVVVTKNPRPEEQSQEAEQTEQADDNSSNSAGVVVTRHPQPTPAPMMEQTEDNSNTADATSDAAEDNNTSENADDTGADTGADSDAATSDGNTTADAVEVDFLKTCLTALLEADIDDDRQLNQMEYVQLLNILWNNVYEGYPFVALPLSLRANFDTFVSAATGEIELDIVERPPNTKNIFMRESVGESNQVVAQPRVQISLPTLGLEKHQEHRDDICRETQTAFLETASLQQQQSSSPVRLEIVTPVLAYNLLGMETPDDFWENATDVKPAFEIFLRDHVVPAMDAVLLQERRRHGVLRRRRGLSTDAANDRYWVLTDTASLKDVQGTRCPLDIPQDASCLTVTTGFDVFVLTDDADDESRTNRISEAAEQATQEGISSGKLQDSLDGYNPNSPWILLAAPSDAAAPTTAGTPGDVGENQDGDVGAVVNGTTTLGNTQCGDDAAEDCESFGEKYMWPIIIVVCVVVLLCILLLPICIWGRYPCFGRKATESTAKPVGGAKDSSTDEGNEMNNSSRRSRGSRGRVRPSDDMGISSDGSRGTRGRVRPRDDMGISSGCSRGSGGRTRADEIRRNRAASRDFPFLRSRSFSGSTDEPTAPRPRRQLPRRTKSLDGDARFEGRIRGPRRATPRRTTSMDGDPRFDTSRGNPLRRVNSVDSGSVVGANSDKLGLRRSSTEPGSRRMRPLRAKSFDGDSRPLRPLQRPGFRRANSFGGDDRFTQESRRRPRPGIQGAEDSGSVVGANSDKLGLRRSNTEPGSANSDKLDLRRSNTEPGSRRRRPLRAKSFDGDSRPLQRPGMQRSNSFGGDDRFSEESRPRPRRRMPRRSRSMDN